MQRTPLPSDGNVLFHASGHRYSRDPALLARARIDDRSFVLDEWAAPATRSVTALVGSQFRRFDPAGTVRRCYDGWLGDPCSPNGLVVHDVLAAGGDDAAAKRAVMAAWNDKGERARVNGTAMHAAIETYLLRGGGSLAAPDEEQEGGEVSAFARWWVPNGALAARVELITFLESRVNGRLLLAGSVDCLARNRDGDYELYDWKRSEKDLSPRATPFRGECGIDLCAQVKDTPFYRYSLQLSLYAVLLARTQGVDVGDRMFIVNVRPVATNKRPRDEVGGAGTDAPLLSCVECARADDMRALATALIERELARAS
jgi:hypothetical protein